MVKHKPWRILQQELKANELNSNDEGLAETAAASISGSQHGVHIISDVSAMKPANEERFKSHVEVPTGPAAAAPHTLNDTGYEKLPDAPRTFAVADGCLAIALILASLLFARLAVSRLYQARAKRATSGAAGEAGQSRLVTLVSNLENSTKSLESIALGNAQPETGDDPTFASWKSLYDEITDLLNNDGDDALNEKQAKMFLIDLPERVRAAQVKAASAAAALLQDKPSETRLFPALTARLVAMSARVAACGIVEKQINGSLAARLDDLAHAMEAFAQLTSAIAGARDTIAELEARGAARQSDNYFSPLPPCDQPDVIVGCDRADDGLSSPATRLIAGRTDADLERLRIEMRANMRQLEQSINEATANPLLFGTVDGKDALREAHRLSAELSHSCDANTLEAARRLAALKVEAAARQAMAKSLSGGSHMALLDGGGSQHNLIADDLGLHEVSTGAGAYLEVATSTAARQKTDGMMRSQQHAHRGHAAESVMHAGLLVAHTVREGSMLQAMAACMSELRQQERHVESMRATVIAAASTNEAFKREGDRAIEAHASALAAAKTAHAETLSVMKAASESQATAAALALAQSEYRQRSKEYLLTVAGERVTARRIVAYSFALVGVIALLPVWFPLVTFRAAPDCATRYTAHSFLGRISSKAGVGSFGKIWHCDLAPIRQWFGLLIGLAAYAVVSYFAPPLSAVTPWILAWALVRVQVSAILHQLLLATMALSTAHAILFVTLEASRQPPPDKEAIEREKRAAVTGQARAADASVTKQQSNVLHAWVLPLWMGLAAVVAIAAGLWCLPDWRLWFGTTWRIHKSWV